MVMPTKNSVAIAPQTAQPCLCAKEGMQPPNRAANEIYTEISNRLLLPPHDAANERDRQRNADSRRNEVVISQSRHLGEVAHRRLATVVLPVGICGERGGSV